MNEKLGIFEAKTRLSEVIQRVEHGEHFLITRRGRVVAELRPIPEHKSPLSRGCAAHPNYRMAPDFDEPLSDLKDYM